MRYHFEKLVRKKKRKKYKFTKRKKNKKKQYRFRNKQIDKKENF